MEISAAITLALGVAWASGLNLYAAAATLGVLGATGAMTLPPSLEILAHPAMIAVAGFLYCVEFVTDKLPGIDSTWDAIHTFIRIPAGAVLAAAAMGNVSFSAQVLAFLLGGGIAATSHALKAGSRILINTSPEPVSNWSASLVEDGLVIGGLTLAAFKPVLFLALLGAFALFAFWLLPKVWRGIRRFWLRITGVTRTGQDPAFAALTPRLCGRIVLKPQAGTQDPDRLDPPR